MGCGLNLSFLLILHRLIWNRPRHHFEPPGNVSVEACCYDTSIVAVFLSQNVGLSWSSFFDVCTTPSMESGENKVADI